MSAWACERSSFDDVANFLYAVIACGIQFENVVTRSHFYCFAGITLTTGLALNWLFAIEHLGKNSGCGCFTRSARTGEEIGLTLSAINDGIAQSANNMLLAI